MFQSSDWWKSETLELKQGNSIYLNLLHLNLVLKHNFPEKDKLNYLCDFSFSFSFMGGLSAMTKSVAIHPIVVLDEVEKGNFKLIERKEVVEKISRKGSLIFRRGAEEEVVELRPSSSRPSLSAELVEAVMYDGNYRFTSERAQEVAMWCGLISFLVMGFGLVCIGLFMALSH